MKIQVKKAGNSLIVRLPKVFVKYLELKENDWIDVSDVVKIERRNRK